MVQASASYTVTATNSNGSGTTSISITSRIPYIYASTNGGLSVSANGGISFTNYTTANGLGKNIVNRVYAQ